jgi:hypothetical protein
VKGIQQFFPDINGYAIAVSVPSDKMIMEVRGDTEVKVYRLLVLKLRILVHVIGRSRPKIERVNVTM